MKEKTGADALDVVTVFVVMATKIPLDAGMKPSRGVVEPDGPAAGAAETGTLFPFRAAAAAASAAALSLSACACWCVAFLAATLAS